MVCGLLRLIQRLFTELSTDTVDNQRKPTGHELWPRQVLLRGLCEQGQDCYLSLRLAV